MQSSAVTVISPVRSTVRMAGVTSAMEHVLIATLDGQIHTAILHVKKDGMLETVLNSVQGIVETVKPVIT